MTAESLIYYSYNVPPKYFELVLTPLNSNNRDLTAYIQHISDMVILSLSSPALAIPTYSQSWAGACRHSHSRWGSTSRRWGSRRRCDTCWCRRTRNLSACPMADTCQFWRRWTEREIHKRQRMLGDPCFAGVCGYSGGWVRWVDSDRW